MSPSNPRLLRAEAPTPAKGPARPEHAPTAEDTPAPASPAPRDPEDAGGPPQDPWRAPIPVEDLGAKRAMAQEAAAAWRWVQRQRAAGNLPN